MTPLHFSWPRKPPRLAHAVVSSALVLAGCAAGVGQHAEGMRQIADGQREAGLARLREASSLNPTNPQFRVDLLREQALYARELLERADEARGAGQPDVARSLYQQAAKAQPGNERALRGLSLLQLDARHATLVADAEQSLKDGSLDLARANLKTVLTENPAHETAQKVAAGVAEQQAKIDQAKAIQAAAQSILRKPVTLQFREANLRMVFEALSRTTGLNVILDRDVRADLKTTIFVKDASVEDTVDLILLQNQLDKRTLNASTLFVYPATPAKQKEYQDLQVRTFQIANGDAKYLQTMLKTVLKLKDISIDERANSIVIRDTPDAVAVAAKVIAANDVPESEVMLEVEVLEISRSRASNIGLQLPTSFSVATPTTARTLGALQDLTRRQLNTSDLSASLNFQLQDTDTNILASPRIRARNKEKAKILIGDRVPTIINSVTPIQTGGSVVTGSVQYQEVGLKLEFEPQIYSAQEVGIKLNLEVSTITNTFTDAQGGRSYQIGTRSAQTSLRLRDGETQVLGGLISEQDRSTAAKLPGLGHIPVVGSLFGNNDSSRTKSEVVLSITPRIIRAPANIDAALREIFSGTEGSIRERALRLDPVGDFRAGAARVQPGEAAVRTAPATSGSRASPSAPLPVATPAAAPASSAAASETPAVVAPPVASPPPIAPAAAPPAQPASAAGAAAAPQPSVPVTATPISGGELTWSGPTQVRVGESFRVTLNASALPGLRDLPITVRFDPRVLRFDSATLGALSRGAGAEPPNPVVDPRRGRIELPLNFAKPAGLAGDGAVIDLKFTAYAGRASTQLTVAQTDAGSSSGKRIMLPGPRSLTLSVGP